MLCVILGLIVLLNLKYNIMAESTFATFIIIIGIVAINNDDSFLCYSCHNISVIKETNRPIREEVQI